MDKETKEDLWGSGWAILFAISFALLITVLINPKISISIFAVFMIGILFIYSLFVIIKFRPEKLNSKSSD